ncbi:hypothetical protein NBRC10512_005524 [Rhodotorula toruloides]|uniref:Cleavage and polyadenylation specificity factor subunit 2 n=2 Tax=Rhodotorula toruloides TaxID=5286 RepID=A0A061B929_RHOTO|nr:cleavage and polyadenylation specificity factor subunit 2 [Rhodotorula toruloides NP11]EMS22908.1 cleavage and polyadenylation specificity factor subunit 2 [Rhodotorula toruloides NP11]CDR44393.1 RHTO0S09e03488g1_1 [Rhodotorula toruloides]
MSITITPLSAHPLPPTYLLTVDNAQILLDCGSYDKGREATLPSTSTSSAPTDEPTSEQVAEYLSTLRKLAPSLNLVLLSHPLLTSLGLLPFLRARCGLRCPVYGTLPTREMGRYAVEEWVEARSAAEKNEIRYQALEQAVGASKRKDAAVAHAAAAKKRKGKAKVEVAEVGVGEDVMVVKEEEVDGDANMKDGAVVKQEDGDKSRDPWSDAWKLTTQEIRDAFLAINAVRWTQPIHLTGPLKGYTLVAHRSGHTLGGSLYTLRPSLSSSLSPASSASSLLYAPLFNHVKEHHLDPTSLLNAGNVDDNFRRMGVMIVGAERSKVVNIKRIDRERKMLDLITSTLQSGGSILLPTDPSARLFELLILLETHWQFANLGQQFPLCLISRTGREAVGFVRSLTEWMGGQIAGSGAEKLKFANLRIFSSLDEIATTIPPSVPKLILTVPSTLSYGYSRALFLDFARNPANLVLLTGLSEPGSLARWLAREVWEPQQEKGCKYGEGKVGKEVKMDQTIELEMKRKVYLEGDELEAHLAAEREAAELVARQQAALERSRRMLQDNAGGDSDDESDSEGEEADAAEEANGAANDEDQPMPVRRRRLGGFTGGAGAWDEFLDAQTLAGSAGGQVFDIYVRGSYGVRSAAGGLPRFRMFPVVERKRRVDAYGEAIDVEGWLRRGQDDDPLSPNNAQVLGKRAREDEKEPEPEEKPDPPHKYVVDRVEVPLQALLFVVDMEGLSDGRALKTILPQINARKLVIVDGSSEAIQDLAGACKAVTSMTEDIYTPSLGETIKVGEETKNFSIRLGDSIMATLRLSRVEDYDVAYVSGIVHIDPESDLPVLERPTFADAASAPSALPAPDGTDITIANGGGEAAAAEVEQADAEKATSEEPADPSILPALKPSLFIGDLRLALLKERLAALKVPSEFTGEGILVCGPAPPEAFDFDFSSAAQRAGIDTRKGAKFVRDALLNEAMEASGGRVAVRKVGRGRLVLEGGPGETYFVVRRAVYALHAQAG